MISPRLVELLVCPENKTPVHEAEAELVEKINTAIAEGELKNQAERPSGIPLKADWSARTARYYMSSAMISRSC